MGRQTEIAAQVLTQEAEYVLALKENQPTLCAEVADTFALARAHGFADYAPSAWEHARQVSKGHGRLEIREQWVLCDAAVLAYLQEAVPWPGLGAIGLVEAERHRERRPRRARGSLLPAEHPALGPQFAAAVRSQWGIENQVHWLLDMAFHEDESRIRIGSAAENFAVLRRLALHLLHQDTTAKCGLKARRLKARRLKARRLKAGWSQDYLLHILVGSRCNCPGGRECIQRTIHTTAHTSAHIMI